MEKVFVITGGAGGIGQACVQELIQKGIVIILDVNQEAIDLCMHKYHVNGYCIDLLNISSLHEVVQKIVAKYEKIDVLIQAAGFMQSKSSLEVTIDDWEKMMKVNVEGMFFMMQEVIKQSMMTHGGSILNFASEAAIRGFEGPMASVHYSASKGAVIAMSQQMAVELGKYHIRVNSLAPGGVMTPAMAALNFNEDCQRIPLRRLSSPADIAKTVSFLCSDDAYMITGQNIIIDGGCAAVGC